MLFLTMLCASNGFQISAPEPATAAKEEADHENGEKDEKKQNEEQEQEKEGPKETEWKEEVKKIIERAEKLWDEKKLKEKAQKEKELRETENEQKRREEKERKEKEYEGKVQEEKEEKEKEQKELDRMASLRKPGNPPTMLRDSMVNLHLRLVTFTSSMRSLYAENAVTGLNDPFHR
jgi:hypothetical protein